MDDGERATRVSRRSWLLAGLGLPLSRAWSLLADTPALGVTWDGEALHVSAPRLHFLAGRQLQRLKDGSSVTFLSQLTLLMENRTTVFRRVPDRLVLSYDLWEEKFSVSRPGFGSKTRLTAAEAEAWCLEHLAISAGGLAPDRPFYLRLELRAADPKELSSVVGEPGISITGLIEIFSRKPGAEEPNWSLEAGPIRLSELTRTPRRGQRTG